MDRFWATLLFGNSAALGIIGLVLGSVLGTIAGIFIAGFCNFLLEMFSGASIGKLILGLTVANPDGSRAPLSKLVIRSCLKNIALIFFLLATLADQAILSQIGGLLALVIFLGAFMMLGSSRQALHDKIAGTAVFHRRDITSAGATTRKWPVIIVVLAILILGVGGLVAKHIVNQPVAYGTMQNTPQEGSTATSNSSAGTAQTPVSQNQPTANQNIQNSPPVSGAPVLLSVSPSSGPPYTLVVITGKKFDAQEYFVYFGNGQGSYYDHYPPDNSTQLRFRIPVSLYACSVADLINNSSPSCARGEKVQPGTYKIMIKAFLQPEAPISNALTITITSQ